LIVATSVGLDGMCFVARDVLDQRVDAAWAVLQEACGFTP
jgi:hypothetical protein